MRVEPVNGGTHEVSGGLLHHWRGTAFVPGGKAKDMLALLRDYNHLATYYAPELSPPMSCRTTEGLRLSPFA